MRFGHACCCREQCWVKPFRSDGAVHDVSWGLHASGVKQAPGGSGMIVTHGNTDRDIHEFMKPINHSKVTSKDCTVSKPNEIKCIFLTPLKCHCLWRHVLWMSENPTVMNARFWTMGILIVRGQHLSFPNYPG